MPCGSGWTFGLSPVVSTTLSDVVGTCVAMCSVLGVSGAPVCVVLYYRHVFFFACGKILGQSDVLIGPLVFLLGLKKISFHSKFRLGS